MGMQPRLTKTRGRNKLDCTIATKLATVDFHRYGRAGAQTVCCCLRDERAGEGHEPPTPQKGFANPAFGAELQKSNHALRRATSTTNDQYSSLT